MSVVTMGARQERVETRAMSGMTAWMMVGEMPTHVVEITPRVTNAGGKALSGATVLLGAMLGA